MFEAELDTLGYRGYFEIEFTNGRRRKERIVDYKMNSELHLLYLDSESGRRYLPNNIISMMRLDD